MSQTRMTNSQQETLRIVAKDRRGRPASLDPNTPLEVTSSDETIVKGSLQEDGTVLVKASGLEGEASILVSGDADLGDGVVPIRGTRDYLITPGQATVLELEGGTVEEQPEEPTPEP